MKRFYFLIYSTKDVNDAIQNTHDIEIFTFAYTYTQLELNSLQ